jgi:hypothetical protein
VKFIRIFIAAILAGMAGLTVAAPAQAAQNCPTRSICLYDSSVSASPFHVRDNVDTSPGACHSVSPATTSWVRNQTPNNWRFYTTSLCGGFQQTVNANTSAAMNSSINNQVRSYKRV